MLDGGVVSGTIKSSGGNAKLTFDFDVTDQGEFDAASSVLTAQNASGTVTINNKTYQWEGFGTLVNALRYAAPTATVTVTVNSAPTGSSANSNGPESAPSGKRSASAPEPAPQAPQKMVARDIPFITGKPEAAKCTGDSSVRTVRLGSGSVAVIHHGGGSDTVIGEIRDGGFRGTGSGWTVSVSGSSVEISDGGGSVSSCSFG